MPFQFIDSFTMITYILDWIKKDCNVTKEQFEYYSKFLYTIFNHSTQLNALVTNQNSTNTKCYKPLSNVVTSLIENFETFYYNMLNHLWIRVILSDNYFSKYTKNIKINESLLERVNDKSIDDVLKVYKKRYMNYYDFFKFILEKQNV